jgi:hypothetical protein
MKKVKLLACLCLSLSIVSTSSFAQKNYFYASGKVPMIDYIANLLRDKDRDNEYNTDDNYAKSDGILFDFGYGINVNKLLIIEAGVEGFFFNPLNKRYYAPASRVYDELDISNRALAFQLKPVLHLELDEDVFFVASYGVNYRKLYSSGTYYPSQLENGQGYKKNVTARAQSNFAFSLQPSIGIEMKIDDRWGMGFELTYIHVNWERSLNELQFASLPGLAIPGHRTSNVFFTTRILFR